MNGFCGTCTTHDGIPTDHYLPGNVPGACQVEGCGCPGYSVAEPVTAATVDAEVKTDVADASSAAAVQASPAEPVVSVPDPAATPAA